METKQQRYHIESWPKEPTTGMQVGGIPAGIKVTDLITGLSACCTEHRQQYKNREAAIQALELMLARERPPEPK